MFQQVLISFDDITLMFKCNDGVLSFPAIGNSVEIFSVVISFLITTPHGTYCANKFPIDQVVSDFL